MEAAVSEMDLQRQQTEAASRECRETVEEITRRERDVASREAECAAREETMSRHLKASFERISVFLNGISCAKLGMVEDNQNWNCKRGVLQVGRQSLERRGDVALLLVYLKHTLNSSISSCSI